MKKLLLLALLPALVATGCKKEDTKPSTGTPSNNGNSTGTTTTKNGSIKFVNSSSNPYYCFVDGDLKGQQPGKSHSYISEVTAGVHVVKAVQVSGYAVYPTEREKNVTVPAGGEVVFSFP